MPASSVAFVSSRYEGSFASLASSVFARSEGNVLTSVTTRVVLLGHPVGHSLSPRMQNAAFAAVGLDWEYSALDVLPEDFEREVRRLAAAGWAGANAHDPAQARGGGALRRGGGAGGEHAVFEGARIVGFNTDKEIVAGIESACACLIGAGGAAEALLPGLHRRGAPVLAARRLAAERGGTAT